MRDAEDTERAINTAREVYRSVPVRGSILYFVIADLVSVGHAHFAAGFVTPRCVL